MSHTNTHNLLLTGAGAPGGPGIIKALQLSGNLRMVVADADAEAAGRFLNDKFELILKADHPDFINNITAICEKHQIDSIFPLVTRELFHFAKHKAEFASRGIKIIVSDDASLQIANDKSKLYHHLKTHSILVPDFFVVTTVSEFEAAAEKLGYPEKEFCFKPSISNGSRGFRIVTARQNEFDLLFNHKPGSTYISYQKAIEILTSQKFPELLLSEVLPGDEYTVDTIVKHGLTQLVLPRKRTRMREGISIKGEFENNKQIIEYTKRILGSLHLHGPIGVQVKQAADGQFKILEINPRIQGTSVAALGMNINLPLMAVMQEFDEEKGLIPDEIIWGTKFSRYYSEVFY